MPDNACGPFHAPAPTQEVTLDEVQVNTDVEPMAIEMGLELKEGMAPGDVLELAEGLAVNVNIGGVGVHWLKLVNGVAATVLSAKLFGVGNVKSS